MLYLLSQFAEQFGPFNLFRYLTFRTGGAVLTALVVAFIVGPVLIRWLKSKQTNGQPIRDDGLSAGTLLWADLSNYYVWATLLVTIGFGLIGFADDYLKVTRSDHRGLPGRLKLLLEVAVAAVAAWWMVAITDGAMATGLALPFFKDVLLDLGIFFIPFAVLVMVGASNSVNLTDGLDGLAIMPVIIAAGTFAMIAYLVGNVVFSEYLQLHAVPGAGELSVFCGALVGAGLGFLWFNAPPAMVFMGDTGSLAVGGALGATAVVTKHELVLAIVGGLFVLETVSVIVQVVSFKTTGRRVFRMAPLHHHFEEKGWAESTIVIRFWIIAVVLALIGLATLKLR